MITLTVYHPTKEFLKFLDKRYKYSVETISAYPNKEGKHELGTIHVEDYPQGSYVRKAHQRHEACLMDGIIGLGCYWHSTPMEIERMGKEMGLTPLQIEVAIQRGISTPIGLRRIAKNERS